MNRDKPYLHFSVFAIRRKKKSTVVNVFLHRSICQTLYVLSQLCLSPIWVLSHLIEVDGVMAGYCDNVENYIKL